MSNLLIQNARMVNEGREFTGDLRIRDERIAAIAPHLFPRSDEKVLDIKGRWLFPGVIDAQVHFREPGFEYKGDLSTEPAAAVAGGVTSYLEMPNTKPPVLDNDALEDKYNRASGRSRANYGFYFGTSNDNLEAIKRIDPKSTPGLKIFMGASTGNMLVDDPAVLERLFACAPAILITHCEDTPSITVNEEKWRKSHGDAVPFSAHPLIRDAEACYKSSSLAVALARKHDTRLHVLHISTARELELFEDKPLADKRITAEVCVHHLLFDDRDYATLGSHLKCNPAVKARAERDALRAALNGNRLDVIGTDHAPHTLEEKAGNYFQAPSGLPLAQHALPGLMGLVHDGLIDLPTLVAKTSHRVADLFQIAERGYLREGYWADLVLIGDRDFDTPDSPILSRCGWSPFAGRRFRSRVATTVVSGRIAWHEELLRPNCRGQALSFLRDFSG